MRIVSSGRISAQSGVSHLFGNQRGLILWVRLAFRMAWDAVRFTVRIARKSLEPIPETARPPVRDASGVETPEAGAPFCTDESVP
jgi:hypothetical protein